MLYHQFLALFHAIHYSQRSFNQKSEMIHNIAQHPRYHHPIYRVPDLHPRGWVPISVFRNQKLRKLASEASFGTLYDGLGRDPRYRHPTPRVPGSLPGCSVPILVLITKNHEKSLPRLFSERFMMGRGRIHDIATQPSGSQAPTQGVGWRY